jgi:hypothetical protein
LAVEALLVRCWGCWGGFFVSDLICLVAGNVFRIQVFLIAIDMMFVISLVFVVQPPMCIEEHDVHNVCDVIEHISEQFIKEKGL